MSDRMRELLQSVVEIDPHATWCVTQGENHYGRDCDCGMVELLPAIKSVLCASKQQSAALPEIEGSDPPDMFQSFEPNTEPLTHQEIFSAVHYHASEIVRLTTAEPAECKSGNQTGDL